MEEQNYMATKTKTGRNHVVAVALLVSLSAQALAFEPQIKVRSSTSPHPQVMGETNFPDGTKLSVMLTRPDVQCAESQQVVVKDGKFHTVGICDAGQGLPAGKYNVVVVDMTADQPLNVVAVIGERGEHMTGPWVQAAGFGRNVFTFRGSIEVVNQRPPTNRPAEAEKSNNETQTTPPTEKPSYDPLPPWTRVLNRPGWLVPGSKYCTENGKCQILGAELGAIPLGDGRTAPPEIGCSLNPEYAPCANGRVEVELLVQSGVRGTVIFRMNGTNYVAASQPWSKEYPDGSSVGGPLMVEENGEILPYHLLEVGITKAAKQAAMKNLERRRMQAAADYFAINGQKCEKVISAEKISGKFMATCVYKGKQYTYQFISPE